LSILPRPPAVAPHKAASISSDARASWPREAASIISGYTTGGVSGHRRDQAIFFDQQPCTG
jgi:hypothetical protein